jgi:protein TonB
MDKNQILQSEWLDILFDGKNKQYGAYDLRKTYNERLKKAMIRCIQHRCVICYGYFNGKVHTSCCKQYLSVIDISLEKFKEDN